MTESTPPPHQEPKTGIPVIGWVGIGCGTILAIAIISISLLIGWCKRTVGDISEFQNNPEKAAAEMMVRMNPDLEKISQDDARGEMTIRTKDGKEVTMNYKDISDGKFSIQDTDGNVAEFGGTDSSKIPSWVPCLPDAKTFHSAFQNQDGERITGLYTATTTKSPVEVGDYFKAEAEKSGVTSSSSTSTTLNGVEERVMSFEKDDTQLNIVITTKPGEDTRVSVGYKKGP